MVHGRVQGVGFRHFARISANRIGVTGWVRNNYDGTVEIWAEGTEAELRQLIAIVNRGPSRGEVDKVEIAWFSPKLTYRSFTTRS